MAKCWFWRHHWHRFRTTLVRKSADCVGEDIPWYRCCRCRMVVQVTGLAVFGSVGETENLQAFTVVAEMVDVR